MSENMFAKTTNDDAFMCIYIYICMSYQMELSNQIISSKSPTADLGWFVEHFLQCFPGNRGSFAASFFA